jgi:hypothetical protein
MVGRVEGILPCPFTLVPTRTHCTSPTCMPPSYDGSVRLLTPYEIVLQAGTVFYLTQSCALIIFGVVSGYGYGNRWRCFEVSTFSFLIAA